MTRLNLAIVVLTGPLNCVLLFLIASVREVRDRALDDLMSALPDGCMKIVWAIALAAPLLATESVGTFTPVRNLTVPREFHTATLLPNGTVLIAGGFSFGRGPDSIWASAEIYDPSTGAFTSTASMTTARYSHTATLLPNGKVLIAGGASGGGESQASAELYDPATGTFTATGSMTVPRARHFATLLNTGKVLIAGGSSVIAELYDPSTGTFAATGDMTEPGFVGTATLLPDGRVLLTRSLSEFDEDHADIYDPATGTFTRTGDLIDVSPEGRPLKPGQQPTATLLFDGKVLIAGGGWGDSGGSNIAEIFDPTTGLFTASGTMTAGISAFAAATLLPEGRVLIAGRYDGVKCGNIIIGQPQLGTCPGEAELFDPAGAAFSPPVQTQSMEGHRSTLLPDGTVLLTGGFRCCGASVDSAELYIPATLVRAPVLFSLSGNGQGQGAIWHAQTGQVASVDNPAVAGEALSMYTTSLADGGVIPPQVAVGGQLAEVLYFGSSSYPGYNQVNFRVPGGITRGSAVSVRLSYLARPSNEVTIGVR
jgi:hypothetical protein